MSDVTSRRHESFPSHHAVDRGQGPFPPHSAAPLIMEESRQARFLILMAISLGFGLLFATFISLVTVPAHSLILEDIRQFFRRFFGQDNKEGNPQVVAVVESIPD